MCVCVRICACVTACMQVTMYLGACMCMCASIFGNVRVCIIIILYVFVYDKKQNHTNCTSTHTDVFQNRTKILSRNFTKVCDLDLPDGKQHQGRCADS